MIDAASKRPAKEVSWGSFTDEFVNELASWIGDRKVLEVFAGNGLLASKLAARGIDIIATSRFAGHDGHSLGFHHKVVEMEASAAVHELGEGRDVLLMSWPPPTRLPSGAPCAGGRTVQSSSSAK